MREQLIDLLEYNAQCNQLVIDAYFENKSAVDEKTVMLLNHILNAQQVWNARILKEPLFEIWQINPEEELSGINQSNFEKSNKILRERNLDEIIIYRNSKNRQFSNAVHEIFFHFVNHSTYHRGQIALLMKQCRLQPINTDYIFYKRN